MIYRTSSAHEEGGEPAYAVSTLEFLGDASGRVRALRLADAAGFDPVPGTGRELPCDEVFVVVFVPDSAPFPFLMNGGQGVVGRGPDEGARPVRDVLLRFLDSLALFLNFGTSRAIGIGKGTTSASAAEGSASPLSPLPWRPLWPFPSETPSASLRWVRRRPETERREGREEAPRSLRRSIDPGRYGRPRRHRLRGAPHGSGSATVGRVAAPP